jgi:hypothetical protein
MHACHQWQYQDHCVKRAANDHHDLDAAASAICTCNAVQPRKWQLCRHLLSACSLVWARLSIMYECRGDDVTLHVILKVGTSKSSHLSFLHTVAACSWQQIDWILGIFIIISHHDGLCLATRAETSSLPYSKSASAPQA